MINNSDEFVGLPTFEHGSSRPTVDEATQFALMLKSGMPSISIIAYFYDDVDAHTLRAEHERWVRSKRILAAIRRVQGKGWEEMNLTEQITFSSDKHYAELAYFLYSHNYSELSSSADVTNADTCRKVLEAKLAGTTGKLSPLETWFQDIKDGRVILPTVRPS